jgi:hypothetical protein
MLSMNGRFRNQHRLTGFSHGGRHPGLLGILAAAYPETLSILADKGGIPLDLSEHEKRENDDRTVVKVHDCRLPR